MTRIYFFFLLLCFTFINQASAQSQGKGNNAPDFKNIQQQAADSKLQSELNIADPGHQDGYHAAGDKMKPLLIDAAGVSDAAVPEKEFVIERSGNIKIEYTPKGKGIKN